MPVSYSWLEPDFGKTKPERLEILHPHWVELPIISKKVDQRSRIILLSQGDGLHIDDGGLFLLTCVSLDGLSSIDYSQAHLLLSIKTACKLEFDSLKEAQTTNFFFLQRVLSILRASSLLPRSITVVLHHRYTVLFLSLALLAKLLYFIPRSED